MWWGGTQWWELLQYGAVPASSSRRSLVKMRIAADMVAQLPCQSVFRHLSAHAPRRSLSKGAASGRADAHRNHSATPPASNACMRSQTLPHNVYHRMAGHLLTKAPRQTWSPGMLDANEGGTPCPYLDILVVASNSLCASCVAGYCMIAGQRALAGADVCRRST